MIEVNFSVCGFFKSLRDFFFTDKKLALGVKTTTQAYRAKIYRKIFCLKFFFESISRIEQRNLEIKQKITGRVVKTTFNGSGGTRSRQHFWNKSKNISTFPDYYWSFRENSSKLTSGLTKTAKNVSRSKLRKILFLKKNVTILFFSPFSAKVFFLNF